MRLFKHKKTGNIYVYLCVGIDATNDRNGLPVVIYHPQDKENTVYVREEKEFFEKFEPVTE